MNVCNSPLRGVAAHDFFWEFDVTNIVQSIRGLFCGWFLVAIGLVLFLNLGVGTASLAEDPAQEPDVAPKIDKDHAKKEAKKDDKKKDDEEEEEEEDETLEETVKDLEKIEGLFTFYRDKEDGSLLMEISAAQLQEGVEFIYHLQTINGAANVGYFHTQGDYVSYDIIRISRHFERIEIEKQNTSYFFNPDNALSHASDTNILPALVSVSEIVATSEDGTRYLIDADGLFKGENIEQISPSPQPERSGPDIFGVGGINSDKTKIVDVRSYARNSNIVVSYTFDNGTPINYGGPDITDGRSVTVIFQHSLIAMPEVGYEPRYNDHRVGYFMERVTDLTDGGVTPYRDLINRWRLVKKDPEAEISEPVTPITYWITKSTPVEYREILREAALTWNDVFEKAGFKNALVVNIQPDDATWEPGDIEYNTIRWNSSPEPYYGGIGQSMTNPRTGEIIAADILLEDTFVSYLPEFERSFSEAGLMPTNEQMERQPKDGKRCFVGAALRQQVAYGIVSAEASGASEGELTELRKQALYYLTLHEVGHTLGLAHNMRGTQYIPYEDVHSQRYVDEGILSGSVMDYPAINMAARKEDQGRYYTSYPGPYDFWAIQFGYKPPLEAEAAETQRMETLLSRSTEPGHAFGNDADDMRSSLWGIDPRVQIFDMSDDAITFGTDLMSIADERLGSLVERYRVEGDTWADMRFAYLILTGQKSSQARVIASYIGGVYVENASIGQDEVPFTPVSRKEQQRAMGALTKHIFAPDAWKFSDEMLRHLKRQRRGWDNWQSPGGEDPRIHDRVLAIQVRTLGVLLHPIATQRMLDSGLYGNDYPPADVLQDLTDAIFMADLRSDVNSYRQNLQLLYTNWLIEIAKGHVAHAFPVESAALHQLKRIDRMERQAKSRDTATAAHRGHVRHIIETALYGRASRM